MSRKNLCKHNTHMHRESSMERRGILAYFLVSKTVFIASSSVSRDPTTVDTTYCILLSVFITVESYPSFKCSSSRRWYIAVIAIGNEYLSSYHRHHTKDQIVCLVVPLASAMTFIICLSYYFTYL